MDKAILFKALQRKNKYRNTDNVFEIESPTIFTDTDLRQAENYLQKLKSTGIKYTFPGDVSYPLAFYKMTEPPLFLEYLGHPSWQSVDLISVVGSRECHDLTSQWLNTHLLHFLKIENVGLVSGGARGVDIKSHMASLRAGRATVAFLPCGLQQIYPVEFKYLVTEIITGGGAVVSEFESSQKIHKSFFYFRNRLIASMGKICLVAQAGLKSGTMLTVHHALQNGRPVATIPAHPLLSEFTGNLKLMSEGATPITDSLTLYDFWKAESWSGFEK